MESSAVRSLLSGGSHREELLVTFGKFPRPGFARAAVLSALAFVTIPAVANVAAAKSPPPSGAFATAYSVPNDYSVAESISQTSGGGFAVGTLTTGNATVLMVDPSGNILSQTQYSYGPGPQSTDLTVIKATSDEGSIFAGAPQAGCPALNLGSCSAIAKVDSTGKVQWANDLLFASNSPTGTDTFDIQQTNDGGFVLAGYTLAPGAIYNPWVAKLSSTGKIQWVHVFADPNSQYSAAYSVRQTADGGYMVGGEVSYPVNSSYTEGEITLFKLDSTGSLVWQRDYAAGTDAYLQSMGLTSDGGAILIGEVDTENGNTYTSSALLLKVDATGSKQFAQTILPSGSISDLNVVGGQQTSDGGYAFAGYYFQNTIYDERAWIVKTDSGGKVQWDKIYGPDVEYSDRYLHAFQQTSGGGFIAAGSTNQFNGGNASTWLVKTDSGGNISNCADVKNDSATTGSIPVSVSKGNLSAVKDSFSYVPDSLTLSSGPLSATRECL